MSRHRTFLAIAALGLLALGGCVAYPVEGMYAEPAPAYVAPPAVYFGGTFGGYRPYYGGRPWGHGGWGHRGWR